MCRLMARPLHTASSSQCCMTAAAAFLMLTMVSLHASCTAAAADSSGAPLRNVLKKILDLQVCSHAWPRILRLCALPRLLSGPCSYLLAGADSAGSSALFQAVRVRLNQPGLHMTCLRTCNAAAAATAPVKASLLACRQDRGGRQCAACSAAAGCTLVADSSRFALLDRCAGKCCILPFLARTQIEACTACSHVRRCLLNASFM